MTRSRCAFAATGAQWAVLALLAFMVCANAWVPSQAFSSPYPTFSFSGAGYGHGIGLSQYGSKGYAERGKTGAWIVEHYFPGTSVEVTSTKTIKVNLDPAANYTTSSTSYNGGYTATRWKIRAGWAGGSISLNGAAALGDSEGPYSFEASGTAVKVTDSLGRPVAGSPFSGTVTVKMTGSASLALLQVVGRSGPFKTSSVTPSTDVRYRGELLLSARGSKLKLLNRLPMQAYLYGVVPRESPASWHVEALKAQSIVARSYAHAGRTEAYCDTRSQMYNGHSRGARGADAVMHESVRSNSAVDGTKDQCVVHHGDVIAAYFSSSSGGYTANKVDVWGGSEIEYLKGVPDPYGEGPYDPWETPVTLDGMELAEQIAPHIAGEPALAGSSVYVKGVTIEHAWPTGFAQKVTVSWSDSAGSVSVIDADTWRVALGLRSTKFFVNAVGDRLEEADRYARSAAASKIAFPSASAAKCVIVASGLDSLYADAACASALSGVARGPVLLVSHGSISAAVSAEMTRLKPAKIYVIGGTSAVSASVLSALKKAAPSVERIAGKDRYETSALVARKARALGATPARVVVASGTSWRDAAVAAAIAGGAKRPLLLTTTARLSTPASSALKSFKTTKSYLVGDSKAISSAAVASIVKITGEKQPTKRLGTTGDKYELAVAAAAYETSSLGFARATVFAPAASSIADVFIASALSSATKHPFVLGGIYTPPSATVSYLEAGHLSINNVTVVGRATTVGLAVGFKLMSAAY